MKKHTPIALALLAALSFNAHATSPAPVQLPETAVEQSIADISLQSLTAEQLVSAQSREVADITKVEVAVKLPLRH